MKITDKLLERLKKEETVCEIEWLDIVSEIRKPVEKINRMKPSELLSICKTYGKVYLFDEFAIVIMTDDSIDEIDYTVIPRTIISDIIEYKKKKVKNEKSKKDNNKRK